MIQIEGLSKSVGATRILDGIDLVVPDRGFVALLGPSGSGKTTLLRIIAGLEHADAGTLHLAGVPSGHLPPGRRGVGFVFQGYALFEHMTVAGNISFGLANADPRAARWASRASAAPAIRRPAATRGPGADPGRRATHPAAG